jgi:DNA-binding LacI/PurR family transcriptional regulator
MKIPKYVQAQRNILNLIASEQIGVNQLLPSEKELCRKFGLSMITIRRALDELAMQAIVARRPGKGTFLLKKLEEDASQGTMAFIATGKVLSLAYVEFFDTLGREMLKRGYKLKYLKGSPAPDEYILRELNGVSGVILCGSMTSEWFDFLGNHGINGIVIGSNPEKGRLPTVQHDWVVAANLMVDHFAHRGCQKIGFINSPETYLQGNIMQTGFDDAIGRHGLQDMAFTLRGEKRTSVADIAGFFETYGDDFDALLVEGGCVDSLFFYCCEYHFTPPAIGVFRETTMETMPLKQIVQTNFQENICTAAIQALFSLKGDNDPETILIKPQLLVRDVD